MELLSLIKENARKLQKKIVLPEGTEERNLKAADRAIAEGLADIILIGEPSVIQTNASKWNLKNISKALIINPESHPNQERYIEMMLDLRKGKGLTREQAAGLILNPLYLGVMLIKDGKADGEVAGAINTTGDVLRPAFQLVKVKPGISIVSGAFIMILKDRQFGDNGIMLFADCAVHPDPDAKQLAEIALATAETARKVALLEPRVAMLSFSTKGSAKHPMVDKVAEATEIVKSVQPDLIVDGELQADAAIVAKVAQQKAPGSQLAGNANVLVFPDLQSGNIAYKLVQRMAGAEAIGPILQGMAAPINDLSRGCSVDDIVNMIAITATQAE